VIKKTLFYLFFISTIAFFYVTCSDVQSAKKVYEGKVVKVTDGDSINILIDETQFRIRLAEIDAPERGQPYWKKSREALANYVAGKKVQVFEVAIDRYERIVGQVYVGDVWVNGELVKGGYAYVYPRYATTERLYDFEEEAQESQVGIWKLPESERIRPWKWRKQKRR